MIKTREEFAIRFNDEYLRETYNKTNVFSFAEFAWDKLPDKVKAAAIMLDVMNMLRTMKKIFRHTIVVC